MCASNVVGRGIRVNITDRSRCRGAVPRDEPELGLVLREQYMPEGVVLPAHLF